MIEFDGPPRAFIEGDKGRYTYTVYAYAAYDPKDCIDAYINWYNNLEGKAIIWRKRPELEQSEFETEWSEQFQANITKTSPRPSWKLTWRCYVIKEIDASLMAMVKPEGCAIPIK